MPGAEDGIMGRSFRMRDTRGPGGPHRSYGELPGQSKLIPCRGRTKAVRLGVGEARPGRLEKDGGRM